MRAGPDEPGDTEPGAWAEHDLGAIGERRRAADLVELRRREMRQGHGQRLEIVEHMGMLQAGARSERALGEGPG